MLVTSTGRFFSPCLVWNQDGRRGRIGQRPQRRKLLSWTVFAPGWLALVGLRINKSPGEQRLCATSYTIHKSTPPGWIAMRPSQSHERAAASEKGGRVEGRDGEQEVCAGFRRRLTVRVLLRKQRIGCFPTSQLGWSAVLFGEEELLKAVRLRLEKGKGKVGQSERSAAGSEPAEGRKAQCRQRAPTRAT